MSDLSPELRDALALHLVPGIGPQLTAALLAHFGSAAAVRTASAAALQAVPHIGPKLAAEFAGALRAVDVESEVTELARFSTGLLVHGLAGYPKRLAEVPGPPPVLYIRGHLLPQDENAVAIVGSRQCTAYGRRIAERLARDLVRAGFTIVSGLARGIDGVAHKAALQAGGRTIAVLAGGLSRVYPPEHIELAEQVQEAGALLTEATMRQQSLPELFPRRNRIVSGLSRGIVVVEAAEGSGARFTVKHALEQNRDVFAVPGSIDSPASAMCLRMIRDGAKLVRGVDDILEELGGTVPANPALAAAEPPGMDATQARVWKQLADGSLHLDQLAQLLAVGVPQLSTALIMLEMKKAVRRLPGNRYERC